MIKLTASPYTCAFVAAGYGNSLSNNKRRKSLEAGAVLALLRAMKNKPEFEEYKKLVLNGKEIPQVLRLRLQNCSLTSGETLDICDSSFPAKVDNYVDIDLTSGGTKITSKTIGVNYQDFTTLCYDKEHFLNNSATASSIYGSTSTISETVFTTAKQNMQRELFDLIDSFILDINKYAVNKILSNSGKGINGLDNGTNPYNIAMYSECTNDCGTKQILINPQWAYPLTDHFMKKDRDASDYSLILSSKVIDKGYTLDNLPFINSFGELRNLPVNLNSVGFDTVVRDNSLDGIATTTLGYDASNSYLVFNNDSVLFYVWNSEGIPIKKSDGTLGFQYGNGTPINFESIWNDVNSKIFDSLTGGGIIRFRFPIIIPLGLNENAITDYIPADLEVKAEQNCEDLTWKFAMHLTTNVHLNILPEKMQNCDAIDGDNGIVVGRFCLPTIPESCKPAEPIVAPAPLCAVITQPTCPPTINAGETVTLDISGVFGGTYTFTYPYTATAQSELLIISILNYGISNTALSTMNVPLFSYVDGKWVVNSSSITAFNWQIGDSITMILPCGDKITINIVDCSTIVPVAMPIAKGKELVASVITDKAYIVGEPIYVNGLSNVCSNCDGGVGEFPYLVTIGGIAISQEEVLVDCGKGTITFVTHEIDAGTEIRIQCVSKK